MSSAYCTILVVDDDAVVRMLFREHLLAAGMAVLEAADGQEALDRIAATAVDVVLLDSVMPGMSGLGVLELLRAQPQTRTLPVILVTGRSEVDDRVRGLEAGATDYLVKPVAPAELVARVRAHLRGHDVWVRALAESLEERTAVTRALCQLRPGATYATAAQICREIATLGGVAGCSVLWAARGGALVTLATEGSHAPFQPGRPVPPRLAAALRRRATVRHHEDLDHLDPGLIGLNGLNELDGLQLPPRAAATPLRFDGVLLGLLVIVPSSDARAGESATLLPAALDFAAIASVLLAPAFRGGDPLGSLRTEIGTLLAERQFWPVFQPIVDLSSGEPVGYEVLTRFRDGADPQTRFAEAAQVGLGLALEKATADAGLAAATDLPPSAFLSLNVSPDFAVEPGLRKLTDVPDRPMVVELTEHDPIADYVAVRAAIDALGGNVQLSVDDAGAGYATLHHVLALHPDYVKLDRSWVAGIDVSRARQALVAGLVFFAEQTKCTLIAEGIETESELATLRNLRVGLGQGFLLGRPEPLAVHP